MIEKWNNETKSDKVYEQIKRLKGIIHREVDTFNFVKTDKHLRELRELKIKYDILVNTENKYRSLSVNDILNNYSLEFIRDSEKFTNKELGIKYGFSVSTIIKIKNSILKFYVLLEHRCVDCEHYVFFNDKVGVGRKKDGMCGLTGKEFHNRFDFCNDCPVMDKIDIVKVYKG